MSNMFSVITQHNCKVLWTKYIDWLRNCRNEAAILLMVNVYKLVSFTRLISSLIKAVISTTVQVKENFKSRYNNHTNSFHHRHQKTKHETFKTYLATARQRYQLHPKMDYRSLCLDIQMWMKKVWPLFNGEIHNSSSLSEELVKQNDWDNFKK